MKKKIPLRKKKAQDEEDSTSSKEKAEDEEAKKPDAKGLIYDPDEEEIGSWKGYKPSRCYVDDGILYLQIRNPYTDVSTGSIDDDVIEKVNDAFKSIPKSQVTQKRIDDLAKEFEITGGKWIIKDLEWFRVNDIWQTIINSKFLKHRKIVDMKIRGRSWKQRDENTQIYLGTDCYFDRLKINAIKSRLRSNGITEKMVYKPDIHTVLGIKEDNPYPGIKVYLYQESGRKYREPEPSHHEEDSEDDEEYIKKKWERYYQRQQGSSTQREQQSSTQREQHYESEQSSSSSHDETDEEKEKDSFEKVSDKKFAGLNIDHVFFTLEE